MRKRGDCCSKARVYYICHIKKAIYQNGYCIFFCARTDGQSCSFNLFVQDSPLLLSNRIQHLQRYRAVETIDNKVARTLFTVGQLQVMVVNSEWSHPRPRHLPKVAYLLSSLSLSRLRHLMDTDVRRSLLSSNSPFTRTITPCKGGQLQKIIRGLRPLASSLPPT